MTATLVHVAVGVLFDADGRVLIARRQRDAHLGGLWEFPGGKVEAGESVLAALRRELLEELGVKVIDAEPLMQIAHDYGDKRVLLDVWQVLNFNGDAQGNEGQRIAWVNTEQLGDYHFPQANVAIVDSLQRAAS